MTNKEWVDLAVATCKHAGDEYATLEIVATWDKRYCSNAVYRLDNDRYLNIFGPTSKRQFHIERAALQKLEEHDEIPAPRIITLGERTDDQPYLIVTGLAGSTAEKVWDDLSPSNKLTIKYKNLI